MQPSPEQASVTAPPPSARPDLPAPVRTVAKAVFAGLSQARGGRAFHHDGVVLRGTWHASPPRRTGAVLFDDDQEREVLVRFSRSFGVPQPLPDALGCAIRWPDAYGSERHQDLVLVTTGRAPGARHALLGGRDFLRSWYSSLLPLQIGGRRQMLAAVLESASGRRTTTVPDLAAHVDGGDQHQVRLTLASAYGPWTEVGTINIGQVAWDLPDLRFNPYNSGEGIRPTGLVHAMRDPAYAGSQAATAASGDR